MKAIIIDDEQLAINALKALLQFYTPNIQIIASTTHSEEGVQLIKNLKPDIVFLDIEMPHLNGFQVLDLVKECTFNLIFVTAYDSYAIRAFRYAAIDYVLKPIDPDILKDAIAKITPQTQTIKEQIQLLNDNVSNTKINPERIILPHLKGYSIVQINDIIYCESDNTYTTFYLDNKNPLTVSKPLIDIEHTLEFLGFFRIHREYLINTKKVKEILNTDGWCVVMNNLKTLPIARSKQKVFLEQMKN